MVINAMRKGQEEMSKQQYIINLVNGGRIQSVVIQARDKREARRRVNESAKIITVKRVVKLSEDKEVY